MSEDFATALLGLGGNVGDPVEAMSQALRALARHPKCRLISVSRLYRTPPWGKTDQDWFFNAAARLDTSLDAKELLDLVLGLELAGKRIRAERWGPRTLDIDILDYAGVPIASERLTIPHPRMKDRAFVLQPLADIAPDYRIEGRPVLHWLSTADKEGIDVADQDREWWRRA